MNIAAKAAGLNARIQNFRVSAESGELEQRARKQATDLSTTTDKLRRVAELMQCLEVDKPIKADDTRTAIAEFRNQLGNAGLKAVQRPVAADLAGSVNNLAERADSSAKKVWRNLFSSLTDDITNRVKMLGVTKADRKAKSALAKVEGARLHYPVNHREEIKGTLGTDCSKWRTNIDGLIATLITDLETAEGAVAQLPEEVQEFVAAAASDSGFPLTDVTPELLNQLRAIGIDDDYTVRQA